MMIVLFRHGPAGKADPKHWPDDRLRPLSPSGKERTRIAAHGVRRLLDSPVRIFTSPLKRAAETAQLLGDAIGIGEVEVLEALAPGGSHRKILEAAKSEGTVVLVGHEPDLGTLAGAMIGVGGLPLKKAGACAIAFDGAPKLGTGRLSWFLAPRILRQLGRKKASA